ncbi:MAG: L,D-transpeptidase family protein, partial [Hyphomicrobiaceae bacterium]
MRFVTSALVCAAGVVLSSGFVIAPAVAERVWTDDISVGRHYVKPPLPSRPFAGEQRVAALGQVAVPSLAPLTVAPLRIALLQEITQLKTQAENVRELELLDSLGDLYGGDIAGPFWVDGDGFKPQARTVAAQMLRADEYALNPAEFNIPDMEIDSDTQSVALGELRMSLAVMAYARSAFGLNYEPNDISLWLDNKPEMPRAGDLLPRLANADEPEQVLKSLHPQSPQFEKLRQAYLVAIGKRQPEPVAMPPKIPDGPSLKVGDSDPQVAMVRERLGVPAEGVAATYFDRALGNEIRNYLRRNGKRRKREINDTLRALLNAPPKPARMPDLKTIEANMLRWRWLPRDLGDTYVWNNIPEYMTRLVKSGNVVHKERIIVGKPSQQTPVFSDTMDHMVFKPQWGVPNSIKITDLLPRLRGGDYSVLSRRNMKIVKNGRTINPGSIRWSKTDIRYLSIVQSPSAWNPLGQMKFMFPNKHSVYMHDTNNR